MWDGWMTSLSESYAKTHDLLEDGKCSEATEEFKRHFTPHLKKLYSEAGETYPLRFARAKEWCVWTRNLYLLTRQTERSLGNNESKEALELLAALRKHLYDLHVETGNQKTNDYIYAFHRQAWETPPDTDALEAIGKALAKADLSDKAKTEPETYAKSREAWAAKTGKILENGKVSVFQRRNLRGAADKLYREYGIQFQ